MILWMVANSISHLRSRDKKKKKHCFKMLDDIGTMGSCPSTGESSFQSFLSAGLLFIHLRESSAQGVESLLRDVHGSQLLPEAVALLGTCLE